MSYNEEHIFQLILEKLTGDISDENWVYLQQAMEQDISIRRCMEEMEEALNAAGPEFMNDVYNERAWGSVLAALQNEDARDARAEKSETIIVTMPVAETIAVTHHPRVTAWWIAAATFLVIATGAYFLLSSNKTPGDRALMAANTIPYQGDIRILLADGDSLQLSDQETEDLHTPQARFLASPGKLAIQAVKNSDGRFNQLSVPAGKNYEVKLSDGSIVHMNAYSSIRFPFAFTGNTREIYLEGEAYFDIAPNAKQPFIVHTSRTAVKVLGTAFNINAYTDSLIVTSLVQGSIMTGQDDAAGVLLKPGEETVFRGGQQKVQTFDSTTTLGWMKGEYSYYNATLGSLASVVFHWYGKTFKFSDEHLANKRLTGMIAKNQPLTTFLETLDKTSGIRYSISGNYIYLTAK